MRLHGRLRIRIHAALRGHPGTEHVHVVVEALGRSRAPARAGALSLTLEHGPGTGPSPWMEEPEARVFRLERCGDRQWVSFGVVAWITPGACHPFMLQVCADGLRVRRRFRLEEHAGHWRLRNGRIWPGRRPGLRRARAETSNAHAR